MICQLPKLYAKSKQSPSPIVCYFRLGKIRKEGPQEIVAGLLPVSREVVACSLPPSLRVRAVAVNHGIVTVNHGIDQSNTSIVKIMVL